MATDALHKRSTNEEDFHRRILQTSVHNTAEGHFRALPTAVHYHPDQNHSDSEDSDVDIDVTGIYTNIIVEETFLIYFKIKSGFIFTGKLLHLITMKKSIC